eukprot:COSAG01_NODE_2322_length_7910_cov_16.209960_10_plen_240_part_00
MVAPRADGGQPGSVIAVVSCNMHAAPTATHDFRTIGGCQNWWYVPRISPPQWHLKLQAILAVAFLSLSPLLPPCACPPSLTLRPDRPLLRPAWARAGTPVLGMWRRWVVGIMRTRVRACRMHFAPVLSVAATEDLPRSLAPFARFAALRTLCPADSNHPLGLASWCARLTVTHAFGLEREGQDVSAGARGGGGAGVGGVVTRRLTAMDAEGRYRPPFACLFGGHRRARFARRRVWIGAL